MCLLVRKMQTAAIRYQNQGPKCTVVRVLPIQVQNTQKSTAVTPVESLVFLFVAGPRSFGAASLA